MPIQESFKNTIFNIKQPHDFEQKAMDIFLAQARENQVYKEYIKALGISTSAVKDLAQIPFLPISFFKTHQVRTGNFEPDLVFTSSGTTGSISSKHALKSRKHYENSFLTTFNQFYGNLENTCVLALLPAYLERTGSSLVYMADKLITKSNQPESGFYLNNYTKLIETLRALAAAQKPTLLLGVSFALLDVAEMLRKFNHPELIVMETGGMKGKRKEIIRSDLHIRLKRGFGVDHIHSEYGMTELLSQAYSKGNGLYKSPPWMRVLARDTTDPMAIVPHGKTGGLNIIDLANTDSCSFIATEDLARTHADGSFEVLGRFDQSDIRGCNLMAL